VASAGGAIEASIESLIKELRQKGKLASDEKTSWVVYDLTREKSLVDINANQLFQAASMIKPFVALAFFHKVQEGELIYGPKSRRKMELMIQRSNNAATNWVMRTVGGPEKCDEVLRTYYGHIFKNTEIVEYIPAGGKTYKNSALPSDYIRFLQALWSNKLPYGKEIRRLMSLPGRDRLYNGTPIPQGTLVYNKTGSTAHLCGDMGILVPKDRKGNRYPYALVGIIERSSRASDYGRWMLTRGNVIRQVSTLVYEEMKKQYKLL
jgi:beta-lactamase class A